MPKLCSICNEERGTSKFTAGQWKLDEGVCRDCNSQDVSGEGGGESGSKATLAQTPSEKEKGNREGEAAKLQPLPCCSTCNKASTEMFSCYCCKGVAYCGPECQRKGWPKHKTECKQIQKLYWPCLVWKIQLLLRLQLLHLKMVDYRHIPI